MKLRTVVAALVVTACTAIPAPAKEGMTARLTDKVDMSAPAGSRVKVAWGLHASGATSAGAGASDHRFYVRLTSRARARATRAWGVMHGRGYAARVQVPRGGIDEVQIWRVGYRTTGAETTRADMRIPIKNPPAHASTMSRTGQ